MHDSSKSDIARKEIQIMEALNASGRIVNLLGFEIDTVKNGSLLDTLQQREKINEKFEFNTIIRISKQISECISCLHDKKFRIIHCDIKAENILIDHTGKLKICDFGSCLTERIENIHIQNVKNLQDQLNTQTTPAYRAPEIVDLYRRHPITEKVDIWAFGVLIFYVTTFQLPFSTTLGAANSNWPREKLHEYPVEYVQLLDPLLRPNIFQVHDVICQLNNSQNSLNPLVIPLENRNSLSN
ncbi:kinase-like protein [Rozella allomycis CSF55]|uniref:non-specific serine/threonine protein kinase n=1 Tax=Rozella allomycis (strain CSF55) TaxID=988480 RepID=A0A4P9YLV1_ROZAC|nr:kinase-like protein [Rozella allomycis CSF55]